MDNFPTWLICVARQAGTDRGTGNCLQVPWFDMIAPNWFVVGAIRPPIIELSWETWMRRPTRPEMKNLHDTDPVVVQIITSARDTTALMGLLIQDKLVGFNFNHSSSIHSLATTTEDGRMVVVKRSSVKINWHGQFLSFPCTDRVVSMWHSLGGVTNAILLTTGTQLYLIEWNGQLFQGFLNDDQRWMIKRRRWRGAMARQVLYLQTNRFCTPHPHNMTGHCDNQFHTCTSLESNPIDPLSGCTEQLRVSGIVN